MYITIENASIKLTVDTMGAQMLSLKDAAGIEYLWDADPAYWKEHAPNLFPVIGRLTDQSYRYNGKTYPMGSHGFASKQVFTVKQQQKDRVTFSLTENEETKKQYPFAFEYLVTYALEGETVNITYGVKNNSAQTMPFAVGGHPGFKVPLVAGEQFTDYELTFSKPCQPDRIGFTPTVYVSGVNEVYPLENDRTLPLRHDLFDDDAIIWQNMDRQITLLSKVSGYSVTVCYPQMPYLGIWHRPKTDAPYVCIEPWTSLPARQDVVEELSCRSDMIHLGAGGYYENNWSISVGKKEVCHD